MTQIIEAFHDVDNGPTTHMDVFTGGRWNDTHERVRFEARDGEHEIMLDLGRDDVSRLHRQLGAWLGANPTGIVDVCPGSGQRPASVSRYGRTGACPVCGDQLHITGRTGVIYKHRRRPL